VTRIYVLAFSSRAALARAFDVLAESERIVSYTIEPDLGRIRFQASEGLAEALVGRIYLDGGLTWCSRHEEMGE
jgi:hypothetical protein